MGEQAGQTHSLQVISVSARLLPLSNDETLKVKFAKLRTLSRPGGLNFVQILGHNAVHLPVARIIRVAEPAHHHVVGIDEVGGFLSITQPGGVVVNNLYQALESEVVLGSWGPTNLSRQEVGTRKPFGLLKGMNFEGVFVKHPRKVVA
jgi:hypothetical protein